MKRPPGRDCCAVFLVIAVLEISFTTKMLLVLYWGSWWKGVSSLVASAFAWWWWWWWWWWRWRWWWRPRRRRRRWWRRQGRRGRWRWRCGCSCSSYSSCCCCCCCCCCEWVEIVVENVAPPHWRCWIVGSCPSLCRTDLEAREVAKSMVGQSGRLVQEKLLQHFESVSQHAFTMMWEALERLQ